MKALYKMTLDFGRQGELEGVFITEKEYIDYLTTHKVEVRFGEVLGKHSDISACLDSDDFKLITEEENVIQIVEQYGLTNGYNPLHQTLGYETEDVPENGVDWYDCDVEDFINFKLHGTVPEYYKEEYEEWLKSNE